MQGRPSRRSQAGQGRDRPSPAHSRRRDDGPHAEAQGAPTAPVAPGTDEAGPPVGRGTWSDPRQPTHRLLRPREEDPSATDPERATATGVGTGPDGCRAWRTGSGPSPGRTCREGRGPGSGPGSGAGAEAGRRDGDYGLSPRAAGHRASAIHLHLARPRSRAEAVATMRISPQTAQVADGLGLRSSQRRVPARRRISLRPVPGCRACRGSGRAPVPEVCGMGEVAGFGSPPCGGGDIPVQDGSGAGRSP